MEAAQDMHREVKATERQVDQVERMAQSTSKSVEKTSKKTVEALKATGMSDDDIAYFIPNVSKFPLGIGMIGELISSGVEGLAGVADSTETGNESFANQFYAIWEDIPLFCLSCCLPCCVTYRNFEKMTGGPCEGHCLSNCLLCCLSPCAHAHHRTQFREKYNIKGTKQMDLLLSCCCGICATHQEAIEIGKREQYRVPCTSVGAHLVAPQEQEMAADETKEKEATTTSNNN